MDLTTKQCRVSPATAAAMQRGLDAIGQPGLAVLVTADFVTAVERLNPDSPEYNAERGSGVVAAKTLYLPDAPALVVINGSAVLDRQDAEIERLLAHEGGHALLHEHGGSTPLPPLYTSYSPGLSVLHATAAVAIEELRIERRLAELGYPIAERAAPGEIEERLFELSCEIFEALYDPRSADVWTFAKAVLEALHRMTVTLSYLAGPIVAGTGQFSRSQLSNFGQQTWTEVMSRSWHDRLQLYQQIPPAGTPYGHEQASADRAEAVEVDRKLLRDLGFTIGGGTRPGDQWSFLRSGSDATLTARWQQLQAEANRRGL